MNEDLEMMKSPDKWPCWPVLCLKRRKQNGGMPECGCLLEDSPTVFVCTIYDLAAATDIKTITKEVFPSLEALLAAGWVVD